MIKNRTAIFLVNELLCNSNHVAAATFHGVSQFMPQGKSLIVSIISNIWEIININLQKKRDHKVSLTFRLHSLNCDRKYATM